MNVPASFPHVAPDDYHYHVEDHKTNVIAIWLVCDRIFDYNLGKQTRTIHSFYHSKKKVYYYPVNSKTVGKEIDIHTSTPYTSMPLKTTPLQDCFV